MSLSTGLPTVATVSAASVSLRTSGAVPVLDFGDAELEMIMEPELMDIEAR